MLNCRQGSPPQSATNHAVMTADALTDLVERLSRCEIFAFDTETTGFNMRHEHLVGLSFSMQANEAFYIPVGHNYPGVPEQLDRDCVLEQLKPVFENPEISKVAQNLKFDAVVLAKYGLEVKGRLFDTMIESYVLNSTAVSRHGLDNLALKYLDHTTIKFESVAGKKGKNQLTFDRVEIDTATDYAAEDADIAYRLHEKLWPKIESSSGLQTVFEKIDMPLMPVLLKMERHGVKIDQDSLARQSAELHSEMKSIEQRIFAGAGIQFNIASPKQIGEVLFGTLGLPIAAKTSTGQPSTSESVLSDLAVRYDVPRWILEHRSVAKLKSTYTDKLPEMIDAKSQRVHTSYHQAVAATGRLSSSDPNLQNIPIRTAEGRRVREAFIAEPGFVLVSIDYSQIELRIMAHLSEDPGLVDAFEKGEDVHRFTASEVFDITIDEVSADQRRHAKAINFGLMYGMSPYGLSRQLQIEVNQANDYVEQYFTRYPKVREFMDSTREKARRDRYVETIYGRRLYLADINSKQYGRRQHAERTAINAPLQGTAADIIKLAMIEVDRWLADNAPSSRMIMQVHDELVLEVAESEQQSVCENVKSLMENATQLLVPLVADAGIGMNWAQAHE
ncbi:MAG: DNA polymerase I [Acidiferrobacterales bacterium]|nr:DNA polymerase I [Acidiferrobacterales bacterium]